MSVLRRCKKYNKPATLAEITSVISAFFRYTQNLSKLSTSIVLMGGISTKYFTLVRHNPIIQSLELA